MQLSSKRFLALLMAIILVLGIFPGSILASTDATSTAFMLSEATESEPANPDDPDPANADHLFVEDSADVDFDQTEEDSKSLTADSSVPVARTESEPKANACIYVLPDAPTQASVKTGGLYVLDLETVFSDIQSHTLTYGFETTVQNEHTKITGHTFYFSTDNVGVYDVTLTASCQMATTNHVLTVTVEAAEEGTPAQYNYDETPQSSVTVYVTLSNDGYPLRAVDDTVMSHLEVTVPYFDLGLYDLEDYYRYGTDGGSGGYVNETIVCRPTGLHLYIYLLERYYMGLDENQCCLGTSGVLEYAEEKSINYMDWTSAYNSNGKQALTITGSATSLYMTNFWGHDENLMYYRNHCYPYMSPGWGATSDYILLSDGDTWDVAMFTDWGFYHGGYFASFNQDVYNAVPGESLTVSTQGWNTTFEATNFEPKTGLSVALYDSNWGQIKPIEYDAEPSNGNLTFTVPETPGTYYLMALDPYYKDADEAKIAPATARLIVSEASCETCVDENGDRICDVCGKNLNNVPVLVEGVEDLTVLIQTGHSYQLDDLMNGLIFTDPDGDTLTYQSYFYRKSSDGGETWGDLTGFQALEHGGINSSLSNSVAGIYLYEFVATDGYGFSTDTWVLTLDVRDSIPADINFYVGRDQNYNSHSTYPVLELYKTAGIDADLFDYVGWFTNAEDEVEFIYNPADYTIIEGETDYVVIDGVQYELHDYEKICFTNSSFDESDPEATASGTVVDNYNMFYATIETGKYSTRAYGWNAQTSAYDIYLGGQSMKLPMEKDIYGGGGNDIYLRVVSVYTTSKKIDDSNFTADDYYAEMIMPVTGSMIHSGDPYVSSSRTYFPFMSYAAGNASLYNIYVYPYDTENYIFSQSINNTTAAGYSVVTKNMLISIALELEAVVPAEAEFNLYFQFNNFNTKAVEPEGEAVVNEDGTKTITYKVSKGNSNYTWRLTDPSGVYVTKAGWLTSISSSTQKAFTFSEFTNKASHDFSNLGTIVALRDEADLQVFLDHDGFMSTSDTYRVRAFRMWQLINSDTANIMAEPDFNIQVLQGNAGDISLVDGGNATSNWIDVTPTTTDIVAVTYDAIEMYSAQDNYGTHGGLFPATAPERAAVFVMTNEVAGSADAVVRFNGGTDTDRGAEWDYNYDTWYYLDTDTNPTLDFTVTSSGDTSVSYAVVTTDSALQSTLSGWTSVSADDNDFYHADMLKFRNTGTLGGTVIIKMTDASGTSYRLVRVAEMSATVVNATNPGEPFMPGDDVTMTFDGLYRSVNKVSGVFNPTTYYLRYSAGDVEFEERVPQYQQMDNTSITLKIPEDIAFEEDEDSTNYTFTNGYIYGSMYSASSPFDTLYEMTDTGVGTNFSAVGVSFVLSKLADIPIPVHQRVTYDLKIDVIDDEGVVTDYDLSLSDRDGNVLVADEDGIFRGLGYGPYQYTLAKVGYVRQGGTLSLGSSDAEDVVEGILTKTLTFVKAAENAWDGVSVTEPATVDGIYQIGTGAELAWFAQTVNEGTANISAVLTSDIDLAGYDWAPIGNNSKRFSGTFDGQGYKVYNLLIMYSGTTTAAPYLGFFGYIRGSTATYVEIKNLTVEGAITMTSTGGVMNAYSGGVIGYGQYVNISNVHADVDITVNRVGGNWQYVGGIIGNAAYADIRNCSFSGNIFGWSYNAGIAGRILSNTTVTGCVNTGKINSLSTCSAGIVASQSHGCAVVSCYNTGDIISGGNYSAGIVGTCTNSTVKNCFNTGTVTCAPTFTFGAVIGNVSNVNAVTQNLYYLEGTAEKGIGAVMDEATQFATSVTAETLASAEFVTTINSGLEDEAFKRGGAHPVLTWQEDSAVEPDPVYGDLDGDGDVSMTDIIVVLQYINGSELTEEQFHVADVNGDGIVNMADLLLILQYINGAITQFPVED